MGGRKRTLGADRARTELPTLLEQAHHGASTVITKRGRPYAAIVPVGQAAADRPAISLLSLAGSGRGLWGRKSTATVARLRDEWE